MNPDRRIGFVSERKRLIEYATTTTSAPEAVLSRLKNKEFKTRSEMRKAFSDPIPKADREIDVDEC